MYNQHTSQSNFTTTEILQFSLEPRPREFNRQLGVSHTEELVRFLFRIRAVSIYHLEFLFCEFK